MTLTPEQIQDFEARAAAGEMLSISKSQLELIISFSIGVGAYETHMRYDLPDQIKRLTKAAVACFEGHLLREATAPLHEARMNTLGPPIEDPNDLQYWYDGECFPGLPDIMEIVKTAPERTLPSIRVCHFRAVCIDEDAIREAIRNQHHEDIFKHGCLDNLVSKADSVIEQINELCQTYNVGSYFPACELDPETRAELQAELDQYWKEIDDE